MAFLVTQNGTGSSERFELVDRETTLGRHPECSIVVDAGAVSRYHAKVFKRDADFLVEDSGSRNGTFLNGQLLTAPEMLKQGDRIRVSDVEFVFQGDSVPEFARAGAEMTFDGSNFGIMMVDEQETENLSGSGSGSSSGLNSPGAKVEFRSSSEGLKMIATAEAKLEALIQINRNLNGAMSVEEVLPKVLSSLFGIFPAADRGFIVMQDPDGNLVPRWVKTRAAHDETETIRVSRTIIREVMNSGKAILSLDASEDSRFDSSQSIADFSIRSMICAPLVDAEGKSFGALQIDSIQGRGQFREEDADLLAGVAAQAGIVINNARMHEQALQQKEVEQDLKLATEVQQAFLPQTPPDATGFRVRSFYQAAHHIGGDYFDYIHLADGRVAIVVADVVGHGVAAAMFMAKLSAETRFCLASDSNLSRAIERLNDRMSRLHVERFITFLVIVIDPSNEYVSIVNAGHMAPLVRMHSDGSLCEPSEEESGLPIAIDDGMEYEVVNFKFDVGDLAVLYTDGINEAMDTDDNEFGIKRLRELAAMPGDADEVKDRIVKEVLEHIGNRPPFDDMCMVVIERMKSATSADPVADTTGTDTLDSEDLGNVLGQTDSHL
ncbi:Oxoglutarate dehydrogenase inhibitor [Rubripirellula lacrimiformis]|uniref:Oxoglutarate dehydrogenase inhibitor n=1 Tax=Rubripirellula lacrimiformis TaxID=1930273 RepID=A0A517NFH8_9BACT|nr:SpoIIE family protein phosphatase [Rubripirellula lacrimiformis]QDT05890.1 Oxoglutarate dehydrogenase inhibitor [Rubripirellula lacrimiformis]